MSAREEFSKAEFGRLVGVAQGFVIVQLTPLAFDRTALASGDAFRRRGILGRNQLPDSPRFSL
jgi:hypothetical protein